MPKPAKNRKKSRPKVKTKKEVFGPHPAKPAHRWRICPPGQHFREGTTVSSYEKKDGTFVHGHPRTWTCVNNPSGRDQMYAEEIREIASRHFDQTPKKPLPQISKFGKKSPLFDSLIWGWTQYWNEVLSPEIPLEPEVVKALIASESSFKTDATNKLKGPNRARGLMQVLDGTLPYLTDRHKELRDHFLNLTEDDMLDAGLSICAGIRWLFRKREIASVILKRQATWEEAVADYKHYLKEYRKNPDHRGMKYFRDYYQELKQ
jgi:hypothetical protein